MQTPLSLIPGAVAELFAYASLTGNLTLADRYGLLAALLSDSLTDEEQASIDRLLYAIYRHRVTVADDLSAMD
ncbi:hypothetical protein [Geitlerinema sp. PCC 7407]|uniref:hypothetical protein n=1 Tax=Geitlerinema sp. PCC 7407 TaxID=1173025 RepID=UPI00029FC273|nr:hypothetical protein [Geitlerinema sp. PCC 7407]AFY66465.1 hypothetical protein GEI7407_1984 [Geitlerinema sp. PCC 7407]